MYIIFMGQVHAEIKIINCKDIALASGGYKKPEEIRTVTTTAIVDTGAMYPVITEELRQKLGLSIERDGTANIANGQHIPCQLTEAVKIEWKDRSAISQAVVIPGAEKILLGVLALEAMDLIVNPVTQELAGAHGDKPIFMAL